MKRIFDTATTPDGRQKLTAARTVLPPSALPLTIDVISGETLDQQVAISGSVARLAPTSPP